MKHLLPIASLTLSAATFAVGWGMKPARSSSPPASAKSERAGAAYDPLRSGPVSATVSATAKRSGTATLPGAGGEGRLGSGLGAVGSGPPLSGPEIAELGQRWKSSRDPIERRQAFLQMLAGMSKENALQIREQIAHLPADHPAFRDFHYAWGAVAGAEAVLNGSKTAKRDMAAALAGWAAAEPDAAIEFYRNLPKEGYPLGDLHHGLVHGLANRSPDLAAEYIYGLASVGNESAERLLQIVTNKMIESRGLEGALAWSETLSADLGEVAFKRPDGNLEAVAMRAAAMKHVTGNFVRQDPNAAAEWVSANIEPDEEPWVIHELGKSWALQEPLEAVSWLQTLENSRGQREGFSSAYAVWGSRDPMAASKHIADLPDSVERDFAINGFSAALSRKDPESAVIWAETISNDGLREAAVVRAAQRYYREDPAAAGAWLGGSGLSQAARERVLASPEDQP